ncbi:hypothetical protein [Alkalisalibacterium limincola]|uniref:hypothetical protein n=1 Tax=Alkalisalibacterium limincola TaxID=2699169 RepID=UPI001C9CD7B4|nr:hypothetical protein [Alkalisalibacterium limincola]
MSKQEHNPDGLPRREFLRRSVSLVGAAGAGLVVASAHAAGDPVAPAPAMPEGEAGYRESEHVKHYYRMADF